MVRSPVNSRCGVSARVAPPTLHDMKCNFHGRRSRSLLLRAVGRVGPEWALFQCWPVKCTAMPSSPAARATTRPILVGVPNHNCLPRVRPTAKVSAISSPVLP